MLFEFDCDHARDGSFSAVNSFDNKRIKFIKLSHGHPQKIQILSNFELSKQEEQIFVAVLYMVLDSSLESFRPANLTF